MNGSSVTADFFFLPPSPVQARVLGLVDTYYQTFKRPVSSSVLADALGKDPTTIREHFAALCRKGWLRAEGHRAVPARPFLTRDK